jgi:sulfate adenylyltransferase large subunit
VSVLAELQSSEWLESTAQTELLRFSTAGSVDDGKSTLIGRLLYDSKGVYEDQLAAVRKATRNLSTKGLDLSLLTDGLRAEREQGITIDVAYRYFSTPRRKFIIADTPGHEQYTRNMATGASTADLAIILIDARLGVLPQSRRHAFIATLLETPHLVVAVNKMDLVDFREDVFRAIESEFRGFVEKLHARNIQFIPISALDGDNVVSRSARTPWYDGPALLEHLETVPLAHDRNHEDFRFPVQYVIRPNLDFRGFAGQISSGSVRRGDTMLVLPSGRTSTVKSITTFDGELEEAFAPMSVTLCLADEVDVSRGDMLVAPSNQPHAESRFDATVVWMNETPLEPNRPLLLKHTTQTVQARVQAIRHRVDINSLAHEPANSLQLNEIGLVSVTTQRPLFFDSYRRNRWTGSFILIDPIGNDTLAAGMIASTREQHHHGPVTPADRRARLGHGAFVIRLTGGTLESARLLERYLFDIGYFVAVIDQAAATPESVQAMLQAGIGTILYGEASDPFLEAGIPDSYLITVPAALEHREVAVQIAALTAATPSGESELTEGAGI